MKFQIEVDCTPAEAREFLGLPDVVPMQEALMKQHEEELSSALAGGDARGVLKTRLSGGVEGGEGYPVMIEPVLGCLCGHLGCVAWGGVYARWW